MNFHCLVLLSILNNSFGQLVMFGIFNDSGIVWKTDVDLCMLGYEKGSFRYVMGLLFLV